MPQWYYSVGGRAEGPVTEEFLIDGLKAGRLTLVDLVFCEGEAAWCTLGEIPKFREAFQAMPAQKETNEAFAEGEEGDEDETVDFEPLASAQTARTTKNKDLEAYLAWIILRKKEKGGFEQIGPFSAERIMEGLASGEFQYSQYAWKPGYKRWMRIGNLPEFDRRKRDRDNDPVNQIIPLPKIEGGGERGFPTLTRKDLLESIVRLERPDPIAIAIERPPAGTDGVDLVEKNQIETTMIMVPVASTALASKVVFPPQEDAGSEEGADATDVQSLARVPDMPPVAGSAKAAIATEKNESEEDLSGQKLNLSSSLVFLSTTSNIRPLPGDPETGTVPTSAVASMPSPMEALSPVADTVVMTEMPAQPKLTLARKAFRLFLAGIAVGTLIVGGLRYFGPAGMWENANEGERGGREDQKEVGISDDPDALLDGQAAARDKKPETSTAVTGRAVAPPSSTGSTDSSGAGRPTTNEANAEPGRGDAKGVDPNLAPPGGANSALESQAGNALGDSGGATERAQLPPSSSAPSSPPLPPSAPFAARRESLGAIQAISPGTGAPSVLEIVALKLTTTPILVFQTNAKVGDKIVVNLKARSGDILRLASYNRTLTIVRSANEIPSIDLSRLDVPMGSYRVEVSIGDLRKVSQIFVGTRDSRFEAEMERHLKGVAFQQQMEKKALFYAAKRFETLARQLVDHYGKSQGESAGWKQFYTTWRKDVKNAGEPFMAVTRVTASASLAYPDELRSLKAAVEQLVDQGRKLDTAVQQQKRDPASQKPQAIIREFARIRQEVAQISSRR